MLARARRTLRAAPQIEGCPTAGLETALEVIVARLEAGGPVDPALLPRALD